MADANALVLQPDVAAKYDLKKLAPGKYNFPGFGEIDLTALDLKKADKLVERGFAWLVAKAPAAAAPVAKAPAATPAPATPSPDANKTTTTTTEP